MKDIYKDAMDAVKAPDALVEKTLKLMLEEHKKLKVETEAGADLKEPKAPPKKTRWITHVVLPAAACLCLCLSVIIPRLANHEADVHDTPPADSRYSPSLETPARDVDGTDGFTESIDFAGSIIEALVTDNLATRSGPATDYRETGTFQLKGEYVRLISLSYDADGLCWAQCEVPYGNKLRRVYTGVQRFDAASFTLDSVPEENPLGDQVKVITTSKAMYGPGDGYGIYDELTVDEGQTVTIIITENDYAQVEWTTSKQSYRAWVPVHTLGAAE